MGVTWSAGFLSLDKVSVNERSMLSCCTARRGANIQAYLAFELDIVEQRDGCTNRTQYEYDDHHCNTENVSQQSASSVHGVLTQDGMMVKVARVPSSNSNDMCDGGV